MKLRSSSLVPVFLVASTMAVSLGLGACQSADEPKAVAPPVSAGQGGTGNTTKGGAGTNGSGNTSAQGGTGNPAGGFGGSVGGDPCDGSEATLVRINNAALEDAIKPNQKVRLKGIVATSHKFLASPKTCLWAFTATDAGADVQEYGSIQVIAKGNPPLTGEDGKPGACPMAAGEAGPIPNDLVPGDLIDATGFAAQFLQPSCDGSAPDKPKPAQGQKQLEINPMKIPAECFTRTAGGAVPAPHVFATKEEMTAFASGTDGDLSLKWGAALITLQGPLKAVQPAAKAADYLKPEDAASKYGDIVLDGTTLAINNIVLFGDLSGTGPKDKTKRIAWPLTTTFESITGLGLVDFCTWSLSLREKCDDVKPPSTTCTP